MKMSSQILTVFATAMIIGMPGSRICTAQTAPAFGLHENTPNVVAFTGARIVIAPGKILKDAVLVVRDEQIEAVGQDVKIPPDAVVRDAGGKTIYPGFIDLYTHYGIPGDSRENTGTGPQHWNPSVRAGIEAANLFKPDEDTAADMRKHGFTAVVTYPREGIFRGSGALVLLEDTEPNRAVILDNVAQSLSFRGTGGYPRSLMGSIALIRQTFLDAGWYRRARDAYEKSPAGQNAPESNLSLEAIANFTEEDKPVVFETTDGLDIFRAADITREFNLDLWVCCCGHEYRRLEDVKNTGARLIVPVNFPETPDVSTDETSLRDLRHWDFAPENPARLSEAGIEIALTGAMPDEDKDFLENVRTAVRRGLSPDTALAALTTTPAKWLNMAHLLGTVEKGKIANLVITDGEIFEDKTKILETWVAGRRYEINPVPEVDIRGTWSVEVTPKSMLDAFDIEVSGEAAKPDVKLRHGEKTVKALRAVLEKRMLLMAFPTDSLGFEGIARMTGLVEEKKIAGRGTWGDGAGFKWLAELVKPWEEKPDTTEVEPVKMAEFEVIYPEGAYGREKLPGQPEILLVKNAVIWTCGPDGKLEQADILVKKGKITGIGFNLSEPKGAVVIDAAGKHITPGLIDAHSHLAISRGVNEGTHSITSETRISDVVNCDDINIYRQIAGGLTMACILHGSANTIGGQNTVIKLRWGALPEEMLCHDAKPSVKFALGENVKRSNVTGPPTTRYPRSRMGVEQFIRDSFQAAKDYRREWKEYEKNKKKNKNLIPPRRDLRLEPLVEILEGKVQVQCHSYRQDEIQAIIRVADEMGFKVEVFIHNLEGYKVAGIMKEHGAMPTVFSDWWAYKFEVYDAIPYNGALLHELGLVVSFNSDNTELGRRMNLEAAKAVKYGNVPPDEALKFVTLNAAIQLGIDDKVGSLEKGKDADFVIWSSSPLSVYSVCEQTWIDGRRYFDITETKKLREKAEKERVVLVQKVLQSCE